MAGSYLHAINERTGQLRNWRRMTIATETQGDAYETIEELFGMVWYLAKGNSQLVEEARQHYEDGLLMSPGKEPEHLQCEDED